MSGLPGSQFCGGLRRLLNLRELLAKPAADRRRGGNASGLDRLARCLLLARSAAEALLGNRRQRSGRGDGEQIGDQRALEKLDHRVARIRGKRVLVRFTPARRCLARTGSPARGLCSFGPGARRLTLAALCRGPGHVDFSSRSQTFKSQLSTRISVAANGWASAQASARSAVSQRSLSAGRSITGIALGWIGPTISFASQVRNAMYGSSLLRSPGRHSPAKANNGPASSFKPNHTLALRLVSGSGSAVHSQKLVTGTRQRRSGAFRAPRQNGLARLRTLVIGRAPAACGPGKPQRIISSRIAPPSSRRSTG